MEKAASPRTTLSFKESKPSWSVGPGICWTQLVPYTGFLLMPPFCSRIKCYCQGFCSSSHISSLCKFHFPGKIQILNCPFFFFKPQHVSTYFNVFTFVCSLPGQCEGSGALFVPVWLKIDLELDLGLWKSLLSKTLEPTKKAKGHWSGCISFVAQGVDILQYRY